VDSLATLLDADVVRSAVRVCPVGLDRRGLVFRVEYEAGHRDVAIAFPIQARTPHEAQLALRALAARSAQTGRRTPVARRFGLVVELFRAGPAAARLCSPEEARHRLDREDFPRADP
jgi:hypothetical protein